MQYLIPFALLACLESAHAWEPIKAPRLNVGNAGNWVSSSNTLLTVGGGLPWTAQRLRGRLASNFVADFFDADRCTVIVGSLLSTGPVLGTVNINVSAGDIKTFCY